MTDLSKEEVRALLFSRIDVIGVQHDLLDGFKVALIDIDIVAAYNRNSRFFRTVEYALFNSIVVLLYSLFETRYNTVNLGALISSLETPYNNKQIEEYRRRITDLKPLIIKVAILRNQAVGHVTTARPPEETLNRANLLYSDVESLIAATRQLFVDISNNEFGTDPGFRTDSNLAPVAVLAALKTKFAL